MKKIKVAILALFAIIALEACIEVPVKQVRKCAKVVDVKVYQKYFLGFLPDRDISVYKILDNGKRVGIDYISNAFDASDWLENAKNMKIGKNYCWIEYEKIK